MSTPLLDETLKCLAEIAGAVSVVVLTLGPRRALLGSAGESLDTIALQVTSRGASGSDARWIADASRPNGVVRTTRPMSVAILPLEPNAEGDAAILLLARTSSGEWTSDVRRRVEAFLPLIRGEMPDVDAAGRRAMRYQQALLDSISDLAWMKDEHSRYVAVNQALASLVQRKPEEMIGATDHDFFPAAIADVYLDGDREVLETRKPYRLVEEIVTPAGERRWIDTLKNPVLDEHGRIVGITGIARDVTEQLRHEEERARLTSALAQQHARIDSMIANVPGVVWEDHFDGSYRYVSDYVRTMLGYEPAEYLRDVVSFMELVYEDDRAAVQRTTEAQLASRRGGAHAFRMRRKDGSVIWCESHVSVILDANGVPIGLRGVSMDITDRKAAEDQLLASEARFRQMADSTPVMIWTTNANGEAEFQNRRLQSFLAAGEAELLGSGWIGFVHPEDRERVIGIVREAHEQQKNFQMELRMRRFDGEDRELLAEGGPRYGADGAFEGFIGSAIDLTDRRRLERRLDEDRRLSSLGRLAATIAHEMNNVLMAIQPFAEVLRKNRTTESLDRAAGHIENAVQRGARITHEILRFANASTPVLLPVDVLACLGAHHHELAAILGPDVDLVIDVDPSIRLLADPHLIQQVFVNLASNARDAMRGSGTFTIRAELEGSRDHRVAHFTVGDTGPGIPPQLAEKVFEPLFTTKTSGTGLGLSIARDIVHKHGGTLTIDRANRAGALFHITLPATDREPLPDVPMADTLPPSIRRVLLVEDDAAVASGLTALLEVEGAEVHVVDRGALALDAVDSFRPDLVILDIGLPDGPGTLVFDGIRRLHPKLPVLFSTGHAGELEGKVAHLDGPTGYLLKPYDFAAVIEAIRRLL